MSTIGKTIRELRLAKGLTQAQLGALCHPPMADSAIRNYESGRMNPKYETLKRIADALGVPTRFLSFSDGYMNKEEILLTLSEFLNALPQPTHKRTAGEYAVEPLSAQKAQLLELFHSLNPKGQRRALSFLKVVAKVPEFQRIPNPAGNDANGSAQGKRLKASRGSRRGRPRKEDYEYFDLPADTELPFNETDTTGSSTPDK